MSEKTMVSFERIDPHEILSDPGSPAHPFDNSMDATKLSMVDQIKSVVDHYRSEAEADQAKTATNSDPTHAKHNTSHRTP